MKGKSSSWPSINAEVSQGLILDPLSPLFYINDLPEGLSSDIKLADDTSLFVVVFDVQESTTDINNDLKIISE